MRIFIGNLPFSTREDDIRPLLSEFGTVSDLHIPRDRATGESRGFGFAEMSDGDARRAIDGLSGIRIAGRRLTVNEARPRPGGGVRRERVHQG
jgi:RNA recognition motif-containing protein